MIINWKIKMFNNHRYLETTFITKTRGVSTLSVLITIFFFFLLKMIFLTTLYLSKKHASFWKAIIAYNMSSLSYLPSFQFSFSIILYSVGTRNVLKILYLSPPGVKKSIIYLFTFISYFSFQTIFHLAPHDQ